MDGPSPPAIGFPSNPVRPEELVPVIAPAVAEGKNAVGLRTLDGIHSSGGSIQSAVEDKSQSCAVSGESLVC